MLSIELAEAYFQGVKRVTLLFDPKREMIGIRPLSGDERGYKISYRSFSVLSLYKHYGITKRGRFPARYENGIILVSLRGRE